MDLRGNPKATKRGLRNNNPFNIQKTADKWKGKIQGNDSRFETFDTVENGIRAGIIDIVGDIAKDGKNTFETLFREFAPEHENDTTAYINFVSGVTGVKPNQVLNPSGKIDRIFLYKLAAAIIQQENGREDAKLIDAATIQRGVDLAIAAPQISKFIAPAPQAPKSKSGILKDYSGLFILALMFFLFFKFYTQLK